MFSTPQTKLASILTGTHASESTLSVLRDSPKRETVSPKPNNRDQVIDYLADKIKNKRDSVLDKSDEVAKILLKKDKEMEFILKVHKKL